MPMTKKITTWPVLPVKLKLLFVDDEKAILRVFRMAMKSESLEIETASNGLNALDRLKIFHADIVITDLVQLLNYFD